MRGTNAKTENGHKSRIKRIIQITLFVVLSIGIIGALYLNSQPNTYDLAAGDIAPEDIMSTRAIPDERATALAADQAALQTADVYVRSEGISVDAVETVASLFTIVDEARAELYPEAAEVFQMMLEVRGPDAQETNGTEASDPTEAIDADAEEEQVDPAEEDPNAEGAADDVEVPQLGDTELALGEIADRLFFRESASTNEVQAAALSLLASDSAPNMSEEMLIQLLGFQPSVYYSIRLHTVSMSRLIMANRLDTSDLNRTITATSENLLEQSEYYDFEFAVIPGVLRSYLRPNMVYDESATAAAKEAARRQILADPVMLSAGTRIVTAGETITGAQYNLMRSLDLVDTGEIDFYYLSGLTLMYIILTVLLFLYIGRFEHKSVQTTADVVVIVISILLVFAVSLYVTGINTILPPVYFVAVVGAAYFGFRTSIILSLYSIILVYPMGIGDTKFLVTALLTTFFISQVMAGQSRRSSYAPTIVAGTLGSFITAMAYGLIAGDSIYINFTEAGLVAISAFASVIAAVGIMPIFEIFLSSVSPLKLITLAQPSQPLLQRLFMEAPGTYQHSMMVANLAEAAAEQIGINALLVRVGAYYHDIGKLENPLMFTENQKGYNPHDYLPPEESVRIIMRHVSTGLKTAQRHRLPRSIQAMVIEHHGTTTLIHFYDKAKKIAAEEGLPAPNIDNYRYPWQKPQSKETAILMLADSLEAAMKSTGIQNVDDAEVLLRRLIKSKNDEDQLIESGLAFNEVETIIKAFLQVYAGQFHERVKYPDANTTAQASV